MGRDATKAAGNPWYQARKKAAEYDDRLCSRESAAEQLGMSVSSLADAELGNTKFMPVDKAVLMADRYNAPWLLNHYCLNECPIGCRHSLSDEVVGIDRVTVKLLKSLKTEKLGDVKDTLLDIAADGKITEDIANIALDLMDVDKRGLDHIDRNILSTMIEKFNGGPVGLDTLAATIGEDSGTIEDVYEPYLIKNGFLNRTPRGRMVTEYAYAHLGVEII